MSATRTCREFMEAYSDARVNCSTCIKWDRENGKCADEQGVVQRYEDTPNYADFKRMMQDAKSILIT